MNHVIHLGTSAAPPATDGIRRSALRLRLLPMALWLAAGLVAILLSKRSAETGPAHAQLLASTLAVALGLVAFWQHGGRQITAAGVYSFASAIFVGVAGLYWWAVDRATMPMSIVAATLACYFTHVVLYYGFWYGRRIDSQPPVSSSQGVATLRIGVMIGATLEGMAVVLAHQHLGPTILVDQTAFVGVVLMTVSLFLRPGRLNIQRLVPIGVAFGLYTLYVFRGFGRLTVASLAVAIAAAACLHLPGRTVKAAGLVLVGPILWLFVLAREGFGREIRGAVGLDGFGSVTSPLALMGRLIDIHPQLPHANGSTFWAALVTLVPHELWPQKPPGFGYVLVEIFQPGMLKYGQSFAALSPGEWLFNFGWAGIVLMVPVLGLAIRWADHWLERSIRTPLCSQAGLLSLVGAIVLAAGMADLMWCGTQIFNARTGTRLIVIGLLFVTWGLFKRLWTWGFRRHSTDDGRAPQRRPEPAATPAVKRT